MNASGCPFVQTVIMRLTPGATSFLVDVGLGVRLDLPGVRRRVRREAQSDETV
jgi:hypothetical protein